jgi:hypothetical protein
LKSNPDLHSNGENQSSAKSSLALLGSVALDRVYRGAAAKETVVGCNDSTLLTITFRNQTVPLANFAALMSSLSKFCPDYSLKRNCCHWFARATMDVASDVFAADVDNVSRGDERMSGAVWRGFRYFEYTKEHRAQKLYSGKMVMWRNRRLKFAEEQRERGARCS